MTDMEMTVPTPEECKAFFDKLPPVVVTQDKPPILGFMAAPDTSDDQVKVSKETPTVIAFADNVSEENRDAVQDGVRLAESYARLGADMAKEPVEYLKRYAEALSYAGWITNGSNYDTFSSTSRTLTMDSLVLEILSAVAGPNAATVIALMSATIDVMQKNTPLVTLFGSRARQGDTAQFRLVPCLQSDAGTPIAYMFAVEAKVSTSSGGALFWKWSVERTSVRRLATGMEFHRRNYERAKSEIDKKLGNSIASFFESFAL